MKFEIFIDVDGLWRWNARYRNGRSAGNGAEGFASERNVRRAIKIFMAQILADLLAYDELEIVVRKRPRK